MEQSFREYEILAVGSELTSGTSIDTNSCWIAQSLSERGFVCARKQCIPDDLDEIEKAVKEALERRNMLVVTGGLGPTKDDLTREGVAKALGRKLVQDKRLSAEICGKYEGEGRSVPDFVLRQAQLIEGAVPIEPAYKGAACGMIIEKEGKVLFLLPGVPKEAKKMFKESVIPYLKKKFLQEKLFSRTIKICGLREADIVERIRGVKLPKDIGIAFLPHLGEVHIKLTGSSEEAIFEVEGKISSLLGEKVYGFDEDTMEAVVGRLLKKSGLKLAVAESCSGGLLGHRITEVPGSSEYFLGGVVAYSNELKKKLLGVSSEILLNFGAVSAECAEAMAVGVREILSADLGVSITGIAGPTGGSKKKPVGLTFIALSSEKGNQTYRFVFSGERSEVKFQATQQALDVLRVFLLGNYEGEGEAA